jgi:hypothetical protein
VSTKVTYSFSTVPRCFKKKNRFKTPYWSRTNYRHFFSCFCQIISM